jgi:two-component system nitrate/nitrite sensor histidine kinase NarX
MKPDPRKSALDWSMAAAGQRLSTKITGILIAFFLVALSAIGLTLSVSWKLEGAAAAINDTGSLRIRTYRIAYHLARADTGMTDPERFARHLRQELDEFEVILSRLATGDPRRPLFIPQADDIPREFGLLSDVWHARIQPLLATLANDPDPARLRATMTPSFDETVRTFVDGVNDLVFRIERNHVHDIQILRTSQALLIVLAIIGTVILIRYFFALVIRPVSRLSEGMRRMEAEDFNARVAIVARDEFGELSEGFNRMAAHLQELYATLEQRVEDKTRSLTAKNRELEILYTISGFLHEPGDTDSLCRGFVRRVQSMLGASAGSVRLLDSSGKNLCLTICEGLDAGFVDREAILACTECMCGTAVQRNATLFLAADAPDAELVTLDTCRRAGFRAVSATTITVNKRPIGIFNLYFREPRTLGESDRQLLEALGQQLGTAIDNLRLQASERELAVSEERTLLARELHDSIAQGLAFVNLQVQMLEFALERGDADEMRDILKMVRQAVQESYEDVRELLVHFRARVTHQDLDTAIEAALRRLAEQAGLTTDFDVQGEGPALDPETESQLLYIVQEAFSNIRKHANAHTVTVRLRRSLDGLSVTVRDDGVGFAEDDLPVDDHQAHIGLQIMRERALRVGAQVAVRSAPGKGTEIRLELARKHKEPIDVRADPRPVGR